MYMYMHTHAHMHAKKHTRQGTKLTFFSRSHLAPKYFKVVANSKKVVASF